MVHILHLLIIILGVSIALIRILSPEWRWLIKVKKRFFWFNYLHISLAAILIIGGGYFEASNIINKWRYSIFIRPNTITLSPGISKKSILKITNNNEYPLYQVDIKISVEEGDLSVDDVKVNLMNHAKLESKIGGITIAHDMIGIGMITKDGHRENHRIIYDIDAHSTKELSVEIDASRIEHKSKLNFNIVRTSEKPSDIIQFDPFILCKSDNKDFKTYHETSKTMLSQKRYNEALICCKKALEKEPTSSKIYNNIGIAYLFTDKIDDAIKSFETAILYDSKNIKSILNLSGVLMQNNRCEEAIPKLETASSIVSDEQQNIFVMWGRCLAIKGNTEDAKHKYSKAISINPNCAPAYYYWGVLLKKIGQCQDAIALFRKGAKIKSDYRLDIIGMWGGCLQNLGDNKKALDKYRIILSESPDSRQAEKSKRSIEMLMEVTNKDESQSKKAKLQ